jgi:hypothetical protein
MSHRRRFAWKRCRDLALDSCGRPDIGSGAAVNTFGSEDVGSANAGAIIGSRTAGNNVDPIGIITPVIGSVNPV